MGPAYPKGYVSPETPVIPKGFIGVGLTYSEDVCNPINISVKVVNDTRALIRIISSVRCLSCVVIKSVTSFTVYKNDSGSIPERGAGAWPNF